LPSVFWYCSAAFYNGLFKFSGLKVLHLMMADGIIHCFLHVLRSHDAGLWDMAKLEAIMLNLQIGGLPAVCVTDSAFRRTASVSPKSKQNSLNAMAPANRLLAEARDRGNKTFKNTIVREGVFFGGVFCGYGDMVLCVIEQEVLLEPDWRFRLSCIDRLHCLVFPIDMNVAGKFLQQDQHPLVTKLKPTQDPDVFTRS
jgi:hypothetical protein